MAYDIVQLNKYPKDRYNVLVPVTTMQAASNLQRITVSEVLLDTRQDSSNKGPSKDIYFEKSSNAFAITKVGGMKLAAAANISIVGTEPAIKPAVERHPGGRILMLATAMTVQEEKFQRLKAQYDDQAQIIPIACSGLMEYVEQGILRGAEVEGYLLNKLEPYLKVPIDAVVLGCTHYPFLRGAIRRIVGRRPEIIDGSIGIARQLERRLEEQRLLNPGDVSGKVEFQNSLDEPEILGLMQALFHYEDEAP